MRERVDRLHRLVEDLLEISRLDTGAATADLRRVDLGAFVASTLAGVPGVTVTTDGAAETLIDPRRLERVIENAIENAARHGRRPSRSPSLPGRSRCATTARGSAKGC